MVSSAFPLQAANATTKRTLREEIETLHSCDTAQAMYALLSQLQVSDQVPGQCSILDDRDDTIPSWQVSSREGNGSLRMPVLIDPAGTGPATLEKPQQWVTRRVLAYFTRILTSPPSMVGVEGAGPGPVLRDVMQQVKTPNIPHIQAERSITDAEHHFPHSRV